jgi:hypothetical protein
VADYEEHSHYQEMDKMDSYFIHKYRPAKFSYLLPAKYQLTTLLSILGSPKERVILPPSGIVDIELADDGYDSSSPSDSELDLNDYLSDDLDDLSYEFSPVNQFHFFKGRDTFPPSINSLLK